MVVCNLEHLLKQRDITQSELANLLGVSRNTISNYIHNKSKSFSMEHMDRLIEILHCSFDDLFTYMTDEEYRKYQENNNSNRYSLYMPNNTNASHLLTSIKSINATATTDELNKRIYEYLITRNLISDCDIVSQKLDNDRYERRNRVYQHIDYVCEDNLEPSEDDDLHKLKHKVDRFSDDIKELKEQMNNLIKYIEYSNRD